MIAQIITPQRTLSAVNGGVVNFTGNGQLNYDDGMFQTYGYPLVGGGNSWTVAANFVGNSTQSMTDTPYIYAPLANDPLQVSVGSVNNNVNPPVTTPETFSTYLMYLNSVEGVWVAIAQLNWSWSLGESRANVNSPWTVSVPSTSMQPTAPASLPPIGPVWSVRFSQGTYQ